MYRYATAYGTSHSNDDGIVAQVIKARNEIDAMKQAILRETPSTQKRDTKQWLDNLPQDDPKIFIDAVFESNEIGVMVNFQKID